MSSRPFVDIIWLVGWSMGGNSKWLRACRQWTCRTLSCAAAKDMLANCMFTNDVRFLPDPFATHRRLWWESIFLFFEFE